MHPIEMYLKVRGLTQSQLAKKVKITDGAILNYIKGRRCPTLEIAYRIQKATDNKVTMEEILVWYLENKN